MTPGPLPAARAEPVIRAAYRHCRALARRHYENFPVASLLLPAALRDPVAAIYAFARTADDYADEGQLDPALRLQRLDEYARRLDACAAGQTVADPVFVALADARRRHALPLPLFHDLLSAFRQDVTQHRYADFDAVLDYCRRSANPIGRLLLHLYRRSDEANLACSDAICSALQLVNFLQDIEQDYRENDRIYLPQDDMARCGVGERHIAEHRSDSAMRALIDLQIARIRRLLEAGASLPQRLPGRLGLQLQLTVLGAGRVLDRLADPAQDLFRRPRLGKRDWARLGWRALARKGQG